MSALPASWFSRVKGYLAAKELVEANVEMHPPPGGGMLLNWPYHSGVITQSHLRRILKDEAKDGWNRTTRCPLSQSHGEQSQEEEVLKGTRSPLPGSVVASSA